MPPRPADARLLSLTLERDSGRPLHRQVYDQMRRAILDGALPAGSRLPSTRGLARELGVSRNTTLRAFDQLAAEGYLIATEGGGSHVAHDLSLRRASDLRVPGAGTRADERAEQRAEPAVRADAGRSLAPAAEGLHEILETDRRWTGMDQPFQLGLPATDVFPSRTWARLMARRVRLHEQELLRYGDAAGYAPLRRAVTEHLRTARSLPCEEEQVLIVNGSQQALDLCARLLIKPGDPAWIEEPGYTGARRALQLAGARLVPIPVDEEGLCLDSARARRGRPRVIYVTPSNQFPMGVATSLRRRLALLRIASQRGAWVIEDDYDSEYRYEGSPIAALKALDSDDRVIYVGTFSKTLSPGMRLGFMVVPRDLARPLAALRSVVDQHPALLPQAVLTDFIEEGYFATHVARTRRLYARRRAALSRAVDAELVGLAVKAGSAGGMHMTLLLPRHTDDELVARRCLEAGVKALPLSYFRLDETGPAGLVLGFAAFDEERIEASVRRLRELLERGE